MDSEFHFRISKIRHSEKHIIINLHFWIWIYVSNKSDHLKKMFVQYCCKTYLLYYLCTCIQANLFCIKWHNKYLYQTCNIHTEWCFKYSDKMVALLHLRQNMVKLPAPVFIFKISFKLKFTNFFVRWLFSQTTICYRREFAYNRLDTYTLVQKSWIWQIKSSSVSILLTLIWWFHLIRSQIFSMMLMSGLSASQLLSNLS